MAHNHKLWSKKREISRTFSHLGLKESSTLSQALNLEVRTSQSPAEDSVSFGDFEC